MSSVPQALFINTFIFVGCDNGVLHTFSVEGLEQETQGFKDLTAGETFKDRSIVGGTGERLYCVGQGEI